MKNFKKLLTLLCLVTIVFTMLTGCDKKVEMVRANSAEEVLNLFNTYNSENNVEEMVKLYSNAYINYIGYDANQIIKNIKANRKDVTINSSTTKSIEDINDNLKKAIVNISAVINGEETNEDYEYALIKEENGWSISPDGIIDCVEFDVPANEDKQLNLRLIKEGVMFNGALIRVNLYNNTNNTYTFGTEDDKTEIIVETSEGTFTSEVMEPQKIDKKDEVIIPEPSFVAYKGCTAFTGATAKIINLKAENDFKLTAQELEEAITEKTKVVIIPFPNNPTGAIMTREELAPLVEVLKDKNVIVISDEIYAELSYDKPHVSIASFPEIKDKTLVINGFSKSYAMTGWRLGYVCGHHILLDAMKKIHQYAIMCSPTTAQFAAIEALKNGDESVTKMVKEYNRRRRVLVNGFRKLGLDCFEPLGAFYVFPCIKSTGMTSDEFCEKLLLKEKVLAVPGNAFGECGEGFIRACYASSMENIIEALKRIEKFLNEVR